MGLLLEGYVIRDTGIGEVMTPPTKYINLTLVKHVKAIEYFEKTGVDLLTNPNLSGIKFDFENNCIKKLFK